MTMIVREDFAMIWPHASWSYMAEATTKPRGDVRLLAFDNAGKETGRVDLPFEIALDFARAFNTDQVDKGTTE